MLGKDGLLRVGGRLANSNLSLSHSHPVIICSKNNLAKSMFQYKHVSLDHCGPSLLLSSVGHRFHVLGARRLARTTCKSCTTCRCFSTRSQQQKMGQLPAPRVTPSPPFAVTGVDYTGPFVLKKGHTRRPTYVTGFAKTGLIAGVRNCSYSPFS